MPRRRANGEGSIFKEASGRYRIAVSRWVNGKRRQVTRTAWKHADAVAILQEMREEKPTAIVVSKMTVAVLLDAWLANVKVNLAKNTHARYSMVAERYLKPRIGGQKLTKIQAIYIDRMMNDLVEEEIGSSARVSVYKVAKTAFKYAINLKLIAVNPVDGVVQPRHSPDAIRSFELFEAKAILEESKGTRYHGLLMLAFTAGLRQAELFGLQWKHVDFARKSIRVEQQVINIGGVKTLEKPKTDRAIRTVMLTPIAIESLREHQAILLKEGNSGSPFVFPAPRGGMLDRAMFSRNIWKPLLEAVGVEHRGLHSARHTFATISLGADIAIPVISHQLGHSKSSTTLNIYGHAIKEHQDEAVNAMQKLFG